MKDKEFSKVATKSQIFSKVENLNIFFVELLGTLHHNKTKNINIHILNLMGNIISTVIWASASLLKTLFWGVIVVGTVAIFTKPNNRIWPLAIHTQDYIFFKLGTPPDGTCHLGIFNSWIKIADKNS